MRRVLLCGLVCAMLLCLCACGNVEDTHHHSHDTTASGMSTTGTAVGNDIIRFNKPRDHAHVSSGLVESTAADKATFAATYDIRWTGMFDGKGYKAEYTLYHYTKDAATSMGLSGLCYGLICVTKEEQPAMRMWVSTSGYAGNVAYPDDDSIPSQIRGQRVYLVDASKTKNPSMYAQFQWGKKYITCQLYDCEQDDLVNFVRSLMSNTPRN